MKNTWLMKLVGCIKYIFKDRVLRIPMLIACMTIIGFFLGWSLQHESTTIDDIHNKMDDLKSIQKIFTTHHYHEMVIEIKDTSQLDDTKLLLIIPSKVSCSIDLSRLDYSLNDSILNIKIPQPELGKPVIFLDSILIYEVNETSYTISMNTYAAMITEFQNSLNIARDKALEKALATGITKETILWGEYLFNTFLQQSGYKLEIEQIKTLPD